MADLWLTDGLPMATAVATPIATPMAYLRPVWRYGKGSKAVPLISQSARGAGAALPSLQGSDGAHRPQGP